jgi:hypothetical protein
MHIRLRKSLCHEAGELADTTAEIEDGSCWPNSGTLCSSQPTRQNLSRSNRVRSVASIESPLTCRGRLTDVLAPRFDILPSLRYFILQGLELKSGEISQQL